MGRTSVTDERRSSLQSMSCMEKHIKSVDTFIREDRQILFTINDGTIDWADPYLILTIAVTCAEVIRQYCQ